MSPMRHDGVPDLGPDLKKLAASASCLLRRSLWEPSHYKKAQQPRGEATASYPSRHPQLRFQLTTSINYPTGSEQMTAASVCGLHQPIVLWSKDELSLLSATQIADL